MIVGSTLFINDKFVEKISGHWGQCYLPAGNLVIKGDYKEIKNYKSSVTITKDGKTLDAGKVMMLMSMGIKCGEEVVIEVTGEDEEAAAIAIEAFFKGNL